MGKLKRERLGFGSGSGINKCPSSGRPDGLRGEDPTKDCEDRISTLPDDLLLLILSLLTCKESARTSLLSRRWVYLWMHTQVLRFDYPVNYRLNVPSHGEVQKKFVNQVNRALTLHRSQNLNEFRITFYLGKYHSKDISSWLGYALKRKVENLELNFLLDGWYAMGPDKAYDFSDRFLKLNSEKASPERSSVGTRVVDLLPNSEKTIRVVNPGRRGNCSVKGIDFRSLKSLSLKGIKVNPEAIHFILQNSPFLERLEVVGSWELDKLVISDPKLELKYLHIDQCLRLECVSISNINLVTLKIKTMSLSLTNLPMLVDLLIHSYGNMLRRLFCQSSCCHSQLGSLTMHAVTVQDITRLSELARLTKLKQLEILLIRLDDENLIKLVSFLEACPCLEEFVFMLRWYDNEPRSARVANADRHPLKCLKAFEFIGYYGRVGELELVMHILENSVVLEKIVLDPFCPLKRSPRNLEEEEEARHVALQQFEGLKESIQPRVVIR